MKLTISSVDYAPKELDEQTPFTVTLLREIPGRDRADYWLGVLDTPLRWNHENQDRVIAHVVLAARWQDTRIEPGAKRLHVNIAYVTDESLLDDKALAFSKCAYVAIGTCDDTSNETVAPSVTSIVGGKIARIFRKSDQ